MTGAQLAMKPRLLYINEQTPETLSLKGTEEEFQAKVVTTKTAASTKKPGTERKGRSQPTSELCGKTEWEDETDSVRLLYPSDIKLRLLTDFILESRSVTLATWYATTQQWDREITKRPNSHATATRQLKLPGCVFLLSPPLFFLGEYSSKSWNVAI